MALATSTSELDFGQAALVGRALGDAKRLCVLQRLAAGEASVGELSQTIGCHVPNMSQHLAVLRNAGLVRARREGSTIFYRLADERVEEICRLLASLTH